MGVLGRGMVMLYFEVSVIIIVVIIVICKICCQ